MPIDILGQQPGARPQLQQPQHPGSALLAALYQHLGGAPQQPEEGSPWSQPGFTNASRAISQAPISTAPLGNAPRMNGGAVIGTMQ